MGGGDLFVQGKSLLLSFTLILALSVAKRDKNGLL
jgi:hypothetical protein